MACQTNKVPDTDIREPAAAGRFYPEDPSKLKLAIEKFLEDAVPVQVKEPIAIIVPHAGYIYLGQICADAFKQVRDRQYDVVVILGTNHTSPGFDKISIHPGGGFRTPLGIAEIDVQLAAQILAADPDDCVSTRAVHHREHSVEVEEQAPIIVASSDLSHYPAAEDAMAMDKKALDAITTLDPALVHSTI